MRTAAAILWLLISLLAAGHVAARTYEVHPVTVETEAEFERLANALQAGDELLLRGGTYSQTGRRAVKANGTPAEPIMIRAATSEIPLLTRPADQRDKQNNTEFVDCAHLVIRGLRFQGGSSGVRFIRGHHVTFEDCEIFETGNNAPRVCICGRGAAEFLAAFGINTAGTRGP